MFLPNQTPLPFDHLAPQQVDRDRGLLPLAKHLGHGLLGFSGSQAIALLSQVFPGLLLFCGAVSLGIAAYLVIQAYWGHDGRWLALALLALFGAAIGYFGA